jgi:hypothetical protein
MKEGLNTNKESGGLTRREVFSKVAKIAAGALLFGGSGKAGILEEEKGREGGSFEYLPSGLHLDKNLPPVPDSSKATLADFIEKNPDKEFWLHLAIPGNPNPEYNQALPLSNPANIRNMSEPFYADSRIWVTIRKELESYSKELSMFDALMPEEMKPEIIERHKDIYGNAVQTAKFTTTRNEGNMAYTRVEEVTGIYFPIPAKDTKSGPEKISMNFELPDGGKVEGFLYTKTETPKFELEGYNVFGNTYHELGSDAQFEKNFKKPLEQAIKGIESLNNIVGGERKFLRNIFIISTKWGKEDRTIMDAHVEEVTPDAVHFFDDELSQGKRLELVGFHEAVHSMDFQLGISEHPLFKPIFKYLPKDFFSKINETYFLSGAGEKAGHSEESELEFLATLVNSLNREDWQNKYWLEDSDFLAYYRDSLQTLREVLTKCGPAIPANAPIFKVIDERVNFLANFLEKAGL